MNAIATLLLVLLGVTVLASVDRQAVVQVIRTAYIEGVHVKGDPALMRQGFHPEFRMYALRDGVLSVVTLDEWAARIAKAAAERKGPAPAIRHEFASVDITGNAAVARVLVHRDGKHVFTDYLSLYRFADGWKIVAKTFQAH